MLDGQKDGHSIHTTTTTSLKQNVNTTTSNGSHPYNAGGAGIAENSRRNIKTCFVLWHTVTIALGFSQFGIGLASWGNIYTCFKAMNGWTDDKWSTYITSITISGAMIGALFSGNFTKYGKKRMIQVLNVILLCSVGVCMINQIEVIAVGRFFWGICAGSYTVMCPKYLNEYLPIELKGTFGGINQLMCTVGIMLPSLLSLAIPEDPVDAYAKNPDDWLVTGYWRVIWLAGASLIIVQMVLLSTVFNYETPISMRQAGENDRLIELMRKMYEPMEIKQRLDQISATVGTQDGSQVVEPTYGEAFFDPVLRKASWVGLTLSMFQQLTGINAIILYSANIFKDAGNFSANQGSAIVNTANMLGTAIGVTLLNYFGRKTLMVINQTALIGCLVVVWFASTHDNSSLELGSVVAFVLFFEFGPGPIVWLYISEICNDKATSVNTFINWVFTLTVSLSTNTLLTTWPKDFTWMLFAIISLLGLVFQIVFMKETRGLSEEQVKRLYRPSNSSENEKYAPIGREANHL